MKDRKTTPVKRSSLLWIIPAGAAVVIALLLLLSQPKPVTAPGTTALPDEVSVSEAAQLVEAGAFLLDVRQPEEWNEAHVEGAILIPLDQLPNRLSEVPKDKEVVVMCRSGNRSATGRDILRKAGYGNVTSMAGGINDWKSHNYPTITGP